MQQQSNLLVQAWLFVAQDPSAAEKNTFKRQHVKSSALSAQLINTEKANPLIAFLDYDFNQV